MIFFSFLIDDYFPHGTPKMTENDDTEDLTDIIVLPSGTGLTQIY